MSLALVNVSWRRALHIDLDQTSPRYEKVVSSLERDGQPVTRDLRWGVYVTFTAEWGLRRSGAPTRNLKP